MSADECDNADSERTVYVEPLPRAWTRDDVRHVFEAFGAVEHVDLPVLQPSRPPRPAQPRATINRGYAFVKYAAVSSATACIHHWNRYKKRPVTSQASTVPTLTQLRALCGDQLVRAGCLLGLWVMAKLQWVQLRDEYVAYVTDKRHQQQIVHQLHKATASKSSSLAGIDFMPCTFLRFSGVHCDTQRGVLQALFGRYGSVAYVDYTAGQTGGVLRTATAGDAEAICRHFTAHPTRQISCGDTLGDTVAPQSTEIVIHVALIQSEAEQLEQWNRVVEQREATRGRRRTESAKNLRSRKPGGKSAPKETSSNELKQQQNLSVAADRKHILYNSSDDGSDYSTGSDGAKRPRLDEGLDDDDV